MRESLAFILALGLAGCMAGDLDQGQAGAPPVPGYAAESVTQLGAYNADIRQTSVSGISSGGYMAVQLHVAFSAIMKGAGVFAGGPYHCSGSSGDTTEATTTCMGAWTKSPDVNSLIAVTDQRAGGGAIDATGNLMGQKVWLFSGTNDYTVRQPVMNALQQYYQHYLSSGDIFYKNNINAGHGHITDNYGGSCSGTQPPYINNCNYDGPGLLLQQIYGTLNPRNTGTLGGQLIQFDQSAFISNPQSKSMDTTGWVFVPAACASGEACKVHIALHGCEQYQGKVTDSYYGHAGYNQWADTNHIIVLYPQTIASNSGPTNPKGCWDWWGYNGGKSYDIKSGDQMAAIRKMVDRLTSGGSSLPAPAGLHATGSSDTSISLAFGGVSGAAGYNVYGAGAAQGPFSRVNGGLLSGTSYTDPGLLSGTTYYYQVRAQDGGGSEGPPSSTLSAATTGNPPPVPAPAGLAVTGATSSAVSLSWTAAPGMSVAGYNVYRAASADGPTTRANGGLLSGTAFSDTGLSASTTYYYVVKAQSSAGAESAPSNQVSATTAAAATCYTDNNWNHYHAGRATLCGGNACALGSGQKMGLLNIFVVTTLKRTAPSYYVIGTCP